jgi:putative membrane protein
MLATIIGGVIGALIFGVIIWLIAKLGLGIEVDSYWWAVTAGAVISAFSNLAATIVPEMSGIVGAIVSLVVAAIVILISDKILRGMRVKGFTGALVAAIAISVVQFVVLTLVIVAAA